MPLLTPSVEYPSLSNSSPRPDVFIFLPRSANLLAPSSVVPPSATIASPLAATILLNCSTVSPAPEAAAVIAFILPPKVAPMVANCWYDPSCFSAAAATAPNTLDNTPPTIGIALNVCAALVRLLPIVAKELIKDVAPCASPKKLPVTTPALFDRASNPFAATPVATPSL